MTRLDNKFRKIGFIKIRENNHGVIYERYDCDFNYTQVLTILYKANGRHIIQSYDKNLFDNKGIGNTAIGLTGYETKLALKKMKQLRLYSK